MTSAAVKKTLLIGVLFIAYVFWQALGTLSQYYPITNYPPKHAGPVVLFGDRFSVSHTGFVSI